LHRCTIFIWVPCCCDGCLDEQFKEFLSVGIKDYRVILMTTEDESSKGFVKCITAFLFVFWTICTIGSLLGIKCIHLRIKKMNAASSIPWYFNWSLSIGIEKTLLMWQPTYLKLWALFSAFGIYHCIFANASFSIFWVLYRLSQESRALLHSYGSDAIRKVQFRENIAMVGQKGLTRGTAIEQVRFVQQC